MKSGDDRRLSLPSAAGDDHGNDGVRMPVLVLVRAGLTALALLASEVVPATAQTATEQGRSAIVPAQASTAQPNGLGMRGPQLTVPNVILADPASEVRLVIELEPAETAPRGSFVRIRGLPQTAALSDGHAIAPGAWAVPIAALKNLRIIVPAGTAGRSEIAVSLVTLDGATIAEAKGSLVVAAARLIAPKEAAPPASVARPNTASAPPTSAELPKEQPTSRSFAPFEQTPAAPATAPAQPLQPPAISAPSPAPPTPPAPPKPEQQAARPPLAPNDTAATPPPPAVAPPSPVPALPKAAPPPIPPPKAPEAAPQPAAPPVKELSAAVRQKAEGLLTRGRSMLNEGNIAAARLFFERSADEGLADGALAMGTTFDPVELQRMRALGTQPDPATAKRWYERAKNLGSREAETKLQALSAR